MTIDWSIVISIFALILSGLSFASTTTTRKETRIMKVMEKRTDLLSRISSLRISVDEILQNAYQELRSITPTTDNHNTIEVIKIMVNLLVIEKVALEFLSEEIENIDIADATSIHTRIGLEKISAKLNEIKVKVIQHKNDAVLTETEKSLSN